MIIETATENDIDDIMKVENASFIKGIREEKQVFLERIKRCPDLFLIFKENGVTAGYLCAELMDKVPQTAEELELGHLPCLETKDDNKNKYIYISSFAILPEYRGNGNGKRMWNECINILKEKCCTQKLLLLVNEEWKGAYHIYEKSGFNVVKSFPSFFFSEKTGKSCGFLMEK